MEAVLLPLLAQMAVPFLPPVQMEAVLLPLLVQMVVQQLPLLLVQMEAQPLRLPVQMAVVLPLLVEMEPQPLLLPVQMEVQPVFLLLHIHIIPLLRVRTGAVPPFLQTDHNSDFFCHSLVTLVGQNLLPVEADLPNFLAPLTSAAQTAVVPPKGLDFRLEPPPLNRNRKLLERAFGRSDTAATLALTLVKHKRAVHLK
jgi:hypothetical protein